MHRRTPVGAARRAATQVGRRGAFLLFLAFVDAIYALSLAAPNDQVRHNPTFLFLTHIAPLWAWAALWGTTSAVCAVGAFLRHDRIPYAAAMFLKVLFGVTLLGAQLVGHVDRAYVGAAVWLVFAAVVYLISTWPEPPARPPGVAR